MMILGSTVDEAALVQAHIYDSIYDGSLVWEFEI